MKFDPITLSKWKSEGITEISCIFMKKGCAGTKVSVTPGKLSDTDTLIEYADLKIYTRSSESEFFEGSTITQVGSKWMVKSEDIHTRCGCGSSFSVKSGNPLQDKIAEMKLAMKQKREGLHG